MIFRRFLVVAEALAAASDEASWRSAISRAYYAAFHVARDLLHELGFQAPRAETAHAFVWLRLSNTKLIDIDNAGRRLNELRGERNRADYQERPKTTNALAKDMVAMATRVIAVLDRAVQQPTRRQITDAIKTYERDVLKQVTWKA